MALFSIIVILFLIMDPIGNIPSYLKLMRRVPEVRRFPVLLREMGWALLVMLFFNLIGEAVFSFLDLKMTTVYLSSGVILFLAAIKILFPADDSLRANITEEEPNIIPLAIPLIAGPSLLATIILYSISSPLFFDMTAAIVIAWLAAFVVLYFARPIARFLSESGLLAMEKLMGMILVLISVQRIMEGILMLLKTP